MDLRDTTLLIVEPFNGEPIFVSRHVVSWRPSNTGTPFSVSRSHVARTHAEDCRRPLCAVGGQKSRLSRGTGGREHQAGHDPEGAQRLPGDQTAGRLGMTAARRDHVIGGGGEAPIISALILGSKRIGLGFRTCCVWDLVAPRRLELISHYVSRNVRARSVAPINIVRDCYSRIMDYTVPIPLKRRAIAASRLHSPVHECN